MSRNHGRRYLASKLQDGSQLKGSTDISETTTYTINIPTTNLRHSTMANSQEVYLGDSNNDLQSETTSETRNTYISETAKSTVKIPTTNLGYKTTYRCKIVSASKYNSDRQPEISKWPPEIIASVELWQIVSKFQRHIRDFRWCPARQKISQMIATTIDYQILHDWRANRLYCHFRLLVVVAVARDKFLRAGRGRKPHICRWNCQPICHSARDVSISDFGGPHCNFRLSVIVAITWRHFIRARRGRKSRTCRWNFDAICCSSGGITTSGIGGHISISGCRSMLWSLVDTFCELAVV